MRRHTVVSVVACCAWLASVIAAFPAGDLAKQKPVEVRIQLGTKDGDLKFVPDSLTFETGKLYKLVLTNPSNKKHYFTSMGLASKVYTRKVQVVDGKGTLAEIKGLIPDQRDVRRQNADLLFRLLEEMIERDRRGGRRTP